MKTIKFLLIALFMSVAFTSCETEEVVNQGETVEEFQQRADFLMAEKLAENQNVRGENHCVDMCEGVKYCVIDDEYSYWGPGFGYDILGDPYDHNDAEMNVFEAHSTCNAQLSDE